MLAYPNELASGTPHLTRLLHMGPRGLPLMLPFASITFISLTSYSFSVAAARVECCDVRGTVLSAMVLIWAIRLGTFLFIRVRAAGNDGR